MLNKKAISTFNSILAKQRKYKSTDHCFEIRFTKEQFATWYSDQLIKQSNKCYYCHTDQDNITKLIENGVLTSKRFTKRGKSLEVERLNSKTNQYSPENCVLICYFCNNDKSDVISSEDYIRFFAEPRKKYIQFLLEKNSLQHSLR